MSEAEQSDPAERAPDSIMRSSAVMAAGTMVSRLSGFVRSTLLAAALGISLHAELFTIANTIPNMLYILLAGGFFNAVLVPQLVRAQRNDPDGGAAYTNRVVTLAALFLGGVTIILVLFAPQVMSLFLDNRFDDPDRAAHFASVVDFARFCLPQVFFYGMFVLVGQILNARGSFGPMMWAPIANNVISVLVLIIYLVTFGPARGAEVIGPFSRDQELLLGLGSTLGIAAQFLILVPYLRRVGFTFRPRFDFRNSGLSHTFRLGMWTMGFVVITQIAYTVVVRLASSGTADGGDGTGYAIYSSAFLIVMVPHSIITVSLATAILPQLSDRASLGDLGRLGALLIRTLHTALVVMVPFGILMPLIALDVSQVIWGHGAAADVFDRYVPTLSLFGLGIVLSTIHYLLLRGFYALEQTRTVFFVQCAVAGTNVLVAILLVNSTSAAATSPALVGAYIVSYAVGVVLAYAVLQRQVGGLGAARSVRFLVRLVTAAAVAAAAAGLLSWAGHQALGEVHWVIAGARGGLVTVVFAVVFVMAARALRIGEVTSALSAVNARLRRRGVLR